MTTHIARVKSGDPLSAGPGSAAAWSEVVGAVEYVERLRSSGVNQAGKPLFADRTMVLVKNGSGVTRDRFSVLGIYNSIISPTTSENLFKQQVYLEGVTPTVPDYCGKFAILAQSLKDDAIGWAWVSGVCVCQVDYDYAAQPYADIKDSDAGLLEAGEGGSAKVLWKETGTGTLWSVVRIGVPHYPILRGKLDGDLTAGGSATMSIWEAATLADSGRNVTVYDPGAITALKKIASGSGLTASWTSGKWWMLAPYTCEVTA